MKKIKLISLALGGGILLSSAPIVTTSCSCSDSQSFATIRYNESEIYPNTYKAWYFKGQSQTFSADEFTATKSDSDKIIQITQISATTFDSNIIEINNISESQFKLTALSVGKAIVYITVIDKVGNKGTATITVEVHEKDEKLTINLEDTTINVDETKDFELDIKYDGNETTLKELSVTSFDEDLLTIDNVDKNTCSFTATGIAESDEPAEVLVIATDKDGHKNAEVVQITVEDVPPYIVTAASDTFENIPENSVVGVKLDTTITFSMSDLPLTITPIWSMDPSSTNFAIDANTGVLTVSSIPANPENLIIIAKDSDDAILGKFKITLQRLEEVSFEDISANIGAWTEDVSWIVTEAESSTQEGLLTFTLPDWATGGVWTSFATIGSKTGQEIDVYAEDYNTGGMFSQDIYFNNGVFHSNQNTCHDYLPAPLYIHITYTTLGSVAECVFDFEVIE